MTIDDIKKRHPEHVAMIDDALKWYRSRPWRLEIEFDEVGFILALLEKTS